MTKKKEGRTYKHTEKKIDEHKDKEKSRNVLNDRQTNRAKRNNKG